MEELVKQHLNQMNLTLHSLISAYIMWYTAFWTLNALALAWIFAKTRGEDHDQGIQRLVAFFFAGMNISGVGSTFFMWLGLREKSNRMVDLTKAMIPSLKDERSLRDQSVVMDVLSENVYPGLFVHWSLTVCAITLAVMGVVWIVLGVKCCRSKEGGVPLMNAPAHA